MDYFTIRKDKNTFSTNDQQDATIVERDGGRIVVKLAGRMVNISRGVRYYEPAEYQVWQITEITDLGEILQGRAKWIISFPVNPKEQGKYIVHHTSTA